MKTTDLIDNDSLRTDIPDFGPGDEVKVHVRVVEGGKERVQVFQGNVIAIRGGGLQETYTVRKYAALLSRVTGRILAEFKARGIRTAQQRRMLALERGAAAGSA